MPGPAPRPALLTTQDVAAVLLRSNSIVVSDDRARLTAWVEAWPADKAPLDAAGIAVDPVHSYQEARALRTAAGYAQSLNPTLTYHPLLRQVDRGS